MQDIEGKDRIKLFAICDAILILAYLIGNWVSVEYIASLQDYDPALPGHLYDEIFSPFFALHLARQCRSHGTDGDRGS